MPTSHQLSIHEAHTISLSLTASIDVLLWYHLQYSTVRPFLYHVFNFRTCVQMTKRPSCVKFSCHYSSLFMTVTNLSFRTTSCFEYCRYIFHICLQFVQQLLKLHCQSTIEATVIFAKILVGRSPTRFICFTSWIKYWVEILILVPLPNSWVYCIRIKSRKFNPFWRQFWSTRILPLTFLMLLHIRVSASDLIA